MSEVVGYSQPCLIFCPNGHTMIIEGKGAIDTLRACCPSHTCEYYGFEYKVVPNQILLEKVEK